MFNRMFNSLLNGDGLFNRIVGAGNVAMVLLFSQTHKMYVSESSNLARIFLISARTLAREIMLLGRRKLSETTNKRDKPHLVSFQGSLQAVSRSIYVEVIAAATVADPEQIFGEKIVVERCSTGMFNRIGIPVEHLSKFLLNVLCLSLRPESCTIPESMDDLLWIHVLGSFRGPSYSYFFAVEQKQHSVERNSEIEKNETCSTTKFFGCDQTSV